MKPKHVRRAEAEQRTAFYATLTPRQKLEALDATGQRAIRQRARLAKAIEAASREAVANTAKPEPTGKPATKAAKSKSRMKREKAL